MLRPVLLNKDALTMVLSCHSSRRLTSTPLWIGSSRHRLLSGARGVASTSPPSDPSSSINPQHLKHNKSTRPKWVSLLGGGLVLTTVLVTVGTANGYNPLWSKYPFSTTKSTFGTKEYSSSKGDEDEVSLEIMEKRTRYSRTLDVALAKLGVSSLKPSSVVVQELNRNALTLPVHPNTSGLTRFDFNQVASNAPIEDFHTESRIGPDAFCFAVFDGHSGRECAAAVAKNAAGYLAHAFAEKPFVPDHQSAKQGITTSPNRKQWITERLQAAFTALDNDITEARLPPVVMGDSQDSYSLAVARLRQAIAGSCALLAYVEDRHVYVACTGDSRAVLGHRVGDGATSYETIELSADQTFNNRNELDRMLQEHPGELETINVRGRVLGSLMPTRAFGDSRYKWPGDLQDIILPAIGGRKRRLPNYLTPPYVTAKPEVTHYELSPESEGFLVLATDGLYDFLSSEEVVKTVARHGSGKRPPFVQLDNASTSLITQAISEGSDENLIKSLSIPAPHSRRYRDDMTVSVLYFGRADPNGQFTGSASFAKVSSSTPVFPEADPNLGGYKPSRLEESVEFIRRGIKSS